MPVCLLLKSTAASPAPLFYRVEIAINLFGEWSVVRDWGRQGGLGRQRIAWFGDLRAASLAADIARERMLRRGYHRA